MCPHDDPHTGVRCAGAHCQCANVVESACVHEKLVRAARSRPEAPPPATRAGALGPAKAESPALGRVWLSGVTAPRGAMGRLAQYEAPAPMGSHLVSSVSATVSISLDREESNNSLCTIECLERLATLFSSMPPWVTHENSVTGTYNSTLQLCRGMNDYVVLPRGIQRRQQRRECGKGADDLRESSRGVSAWLVGSQCSSKA